MNQLMNKAEFEKIEKLKLINKNKLRRAEYYIRLG